jgi:hypothetical protein
LKNQAQLTRRADACRRGLVLIDPSTEDELTEAFRWMGEVQGAATNFGGAGDERVLLSRMSLNDRRPGSDLLESREQGGPEAPG